MSARGRAGNCSTHCAGNRLLGNMSGDDGDADQTGAKVAKFDDSGKPIMVTKLRTKVQVRKGDAGRQGAPAPADVPATPAAAAYTAVKQRNRHYGWQPDLPDHRDLPYGALRLGLEAPATLPPSVDLRAHCPPIYDQHPLQSCTANALAAAFRFLEIKSGSNKLNPSRLFIYYNERDLENQVDSDNGAQLRDGIKSIATSGICDEADWSYDEPFAQKPPQSCFDKALKFKAVNYFCLNKASLDELRGCLAAGFPFVFGFSICASFNNADFNNGIVTMPDHGEPIEGGHAVMAVGYDDAARLFTVQNSWGPTRGDHGYFYMPYNYVTSSMADSFWTVRAISGSAIAGTPNTAAAVAALKQQGLDQLTPAPLQGKAAPEVTEAAVTVHHGKRYQATITLSWLEQQFAANGMIAGQFAQLGFTEVAVTGDGATRRATGRWMGADTTVALDPHLSGVIELA